MKPFLRPLSLALFALTGVAHAEPPQGAGPRPSHSARGVAPFPSGREQLRRIGPGQSGELLERLRHSGRLPVDGLRAQGRQARGRERAFEAALRTPDITEDAVREKMQEMRDHADEMRRERRRALHARWGAGAERPEAKTELERHGRTLARIRRLQFLAATERKGEVRAALLERLARARDLERGRHERAMQVLSGGGQASANGAPAPSGSVATGLPRPPNGPRSKPVGVSAPAMKTVPPKGDAP